MRHLFDRTEATLTFDPERLLRFKYSSLRVKAAHFFAWLLERISGITYKAVMPQRLESIEPEIIEFLPILQTLHHHDVVDRNTHIISRGHVFPDEPRVHSYFVGDRGGGLDFFVPQNAIWKALAEHVERHFWSKVDFSWMTHHIQQATYVDMCKKGKALNPESVAGFSLSQRKDDTHLVYDETTEFSWAQCSSNRGTLWVPFQLISPLYCRKSVWHPEIKTERGGREPMLRWMITTGLATGPSRVEAEAKGILEVIERDAFMVTYLNKLSPEKIDLEYLGTQDPEIKEILRRFKKYNLEIHVSRLVTDFSSMGVYVFCVSIVDRTGLGPAITIGAKADFSERTAIVGAIAEALGVRFACKRSFKKNIDGLTLDRDERVIYWARSLDMIEKLDFLIKGDRIKIDIDKAEIREGRDRKSFYEKKKDILVNFLTKKGYTYIPVPVIPPHIERELPIRSVFVIIPELQPLHLNELAPYMGGKRLREVSLACGFDPREDLNTVPHPFP